MVDGGGMGRGGSETGGTVASLSHRRRGRRVRHLRTNPKRWREESSVEEGRDLQIGGGRNPNGVRR